MTLVFRHHPVLHALRLTGSFTARDPDAFVASLPQVLPVRIAGAERGARVVHMRR